MAAMLAMTRWRNRKRNGLCVISLLGILGCLMVAFPPRSAELPPWKGWGEEVAGTDPHNHVAAEMEILQMVLINRGTEEEVLSLEVLVTVLAIFKLGLDIREDSEDKLMLDLTIREGCLARRYSNAERATLL